MKTKELSVRHPYFVLLKSGEKQVEGRLYDDFFRDLSKNDVLIFIDEDNGEKLKMEIEKIDVFDDFSKMIEFFGKTILGFAKFSEEETLKTYNSFYSMEEIKEKGVCGVSVRKL